MMTGQRINDSPSNGDTRMASSSLSSRALTLTNDGRRRLINPFVHEIKCTNWHRFKLFLGGLILLPFRVTMALIFLGLASLLANISLLIMSLFKLSENHRLKMRQFLKSPVLFLMRTMFFLGGFYRTRLVDQDGNQVSIDSIEAPIICLAPHSSLFDILPYIVLGAPAVVAKREAKYTPFIGSVLMLSDPILVQRDCKLSRTETIQTIQHKAMKEKILIFPEGTCTNRSLLIQFKLGAFLPGLPVQPVAIRYYIPPQIDDITWTWEGPGSAKVILYSLCRWRTNLDVIILPAYYPDAQEKQDPQLFAANVRNLMANFLSIPTSLYSYDDVHFLKFVSEWKIPRSPACLKFVKLSYRILRDEKKGLKEHCPKASRPPPGFPSSNGMTRHVDAPILPHSSQNLPSAFHSYASTTSLLSTASSDSTSSPYNDRQLAQPRIGWNSNDKLRHRNSPVHTDGHDSTRIGTLADGTELPTRQAGPHSEHENNESMTELTLGDLTKFINKIRLDLAVLPKDIHIKSKEDLIHILRVTHCSGIGTSSSVNELYLCLNHPHQMPFMVKDLLLLCELCDSRTENLWDRLRTAFDMMASIRDEKTVLGNNKLFRHITPTISVHQFKLLMWYLLGFSELSDELLSSLSQERLTFERMQQILINDFRDLCRQNAPYLLSSEPNIKHNELANNSSQPMGQSGHDNLAFSSQETLIPNSQRQYITNHNSALHPVQI